MKRLYFILLAAFPAVAIAESQEVGGVTWFYRDLGEGVEIISPCEDGGTIDEIAAICDDVKVPSTLGGKPVTSIGYGAFIGAGFSGVTLPEGLTKIGDSAFECTEISQIDFPSTLTTIGYAAFKDCFFLTSVDLPDTVSEIGGEAFAYTGLESFKLPLSVSNVNWRLCENCYLLADVKLHNGVRRIEDWAFGVENDPSGGIGIQFWDFKMPPNLEWIGVDAFRNRLVLEEFAIPDGMKSLDLGAFNHCQVHRLTIPDREFCISKWGSGDDWTMISMVATPWNKLDEVMDALTYYNDLGGGWVEVMRWGPQVLAITDEVEEIPDGKFAGIGEMEAFIFPAGLKRIGNAAFSNCWNMTKTYFPKTLEVIGDHAFADCSCFGGHGNWTDGALTDHIDIPASVKYIGKGAFTVQESAIVHVMDKFFFEGPPPACHAEAFTNETPFGATKGYYLPQYAKEWQAVIDENGEYGGLPMYLADGGDTDLYSDANGLTWPYYLEGDYAILGYAANSDKLAWSRFYGASSSIRAINGDIVLPSVLDGHPVRGIEADVFIWYGPVNSITIPSSIQEVRGADQGIFEFRSYTWPSRIRYCGKPPADLEKHYAFYTTTTLYEYPLSKEAEWLAFFEKNGITVKAMPYDDSGENDPQDYTRELKVSAMAYAGIYDGNPHTISVKVEGEYEMLAIDYATSPRGPYTSKPPTFTSICEGQAVHYRVTAKDCRPVYGYELVTIYQDLGLVTVKTPVPVPVEWLKAVYKLGENANFEAAAQRYTGKVDPVLGKLQAWQEYVMGTDPSDPNSRFLVGLEPKEEGGFRVTWSPDKSNEHHIYIVLGKRSLSDSEWTVIPDPENPPEGFCFFGAKVDLDDYMMGLLKAQRPAVHFAGDVNGDGKVSDEDLTKLKNYLTYLNQIKSGLASEHISHDWSLTADELDAADVNGDGVVDRDDEKALKTLIKGI